LLSRFRSILFLEPLIEGDIDGREAPEFFGDLNLDQIVASVTAGRDEYNLKPFFYAPLRSVEAICYRHEVMRDLENEALLGHVRTFSRKLRTMRESLAQADKLYYERQKQRWFLDAVDIYCDAVRCLMQDLQSAYPRSRGFRGLREYLETYTASGDFATLVSDTQKLKADLAGVLYTLHIDGARIRVSRYDSESDYGAEVLQTFEKFKQGVPREYRFDFRESLNMNHVEAAVLDRVAKLYPDVFLELERYCDRHRYYLDDTIRSFDREVQFYVAWLEHGARLKRAGLSFCYPVVADRSKAVHCRESFDLALADRLVRENVSVVTNDFHLEDPERVFIVSGPNQGGKTTFARTFGQLHYLANLGCSVPGRQARLFLFDSLFTHFDREEDIGNLSGKLEDDLRRIRAILARATPRSILIMNESFSSTTLNDALFLSKRVLQQIVQRDMLCVYVTFLDELASFSKSAVSMVSTVDARDPALRTFKIVRRPADGLAYAAALAQKYRLSYLSVKERVAS